MLALVLAVLSLVALPADGQERSINLIDIHQGSPLSAEVEFLSWGSYELSDGTLQRFDAWYSTHWPELSATWLLQLDPDNGVLFGLDSGEAGEKYRIDPSIKLGIITQTHPRPNATLSLTASTILWGHLTEYPCTADYGELGTYEVNCRLAASEISPEDTLTYLLNEDPSRLSLTLTYSVDF